jgi:hypothetical protein
MLHRFSRWSFGLVLLLAASPGPGAEAWAFRFDLRTFNNSWHDDLSFHNTTDQDAVVRLLGVSNGTIDEGTPLDVAVPAGRTVSLSDLFGVWQLGVEADLWVARFDVPEGVLVSSRGGLDSECPSPCGAPPNPFPDLGAFTMPVFRSLTPAGARQFHFGADLGKQSSRSNVGIYNGGAAAGTATIALYRACDDALLGVRTVRLPANFALQVGITGDDAPVACSDPSKLNTWLRYVTVTMDQPSLTYVFNVVKDLNPYPHLPFGLAGF